MSNNVQIIARRAPSPRLERILGPLALVFAADLVGAFRPRLLGLMAARRESSVLDARAPEQSAEVQVAPWRCAPVPPALEDRRVELVGPVDRMSLFGALESRPDAFVADFDNATSPTWSNVLEGHLNVRDAVHGTLDVEVAGVRRPLAGPAPPILLRPRALHLHEDHVTIEQAPAPAALFDVAMHSFHNARTLAARGEGPFFSLTKLHGRLEARFYNDVFAYLERALTVPRGTFKVSVRIDTVEAAHEMHEILWELRERAIGLGCGRWDYVQSLIEARADDRGAVLADRRHLTVDRAPLAACAERVVEACHARGVQAVGPMSNEAPISPRQEGVPAILASVRAAGHAQATRGFVGMRIAHPSLVEVARTAFDSRGEPAAMPPSREADLFRVRPGAPSEDAVRDNVRIGLLHLDAWLSGRGRIAHGTTVEDAGTARAARALLWQWVRHYVCLDDGSVLTRTRFREIVACEAERLAVSSRVRDVFERICLAPRLSPIDASDVPAPSRVAVRPDRSRRCSASPPGEL